MARWQAEVTQSQSQAVMVFTIFTVMSVPPSLSLSSLSLTQIEKHPPTLKTLTTNSFLPLSFFTSLFGMNASEWSGEATNLSLATMFEIAG